VIYHLELFEILIQMYVMFLFSKSSNPGREQKKFLFPKTSRQAPGSTQPPIQG